jgi:putative transposase
MTFNPYARQRRSLRLQGYDYAQNGAYFITICTHKKHNLFGEITSGEMQLNKPGIIVHEKWLKTATLRQYLELDEFIIMSNHVHGIIYLASSCRGTARRAPAEEFGKPVATSIPTIVRAYKSAVTKRINELRRTPSASVWQRNYYERVIRNENDLNQIREYIAYNPARWDEDEENPAQANMLKSKRLVKS